MHTIAAKAVSFKEALTPEFNKYQRQIVINAKTLANDLIEKGYDIVSGGTDNHLMLIDLTKLGITGKDAEAALGRAGIITNKNTIPFETRSPFITSGVRIGTPAITTRGMKEQQMHIIADYIDIVLRHSSGDNKLEEIKQKIKQLCSQFPVYI
jgi:glycine hydroxymethyltransferase